MFEINVYKLNEVLFQIDCDTGIKTELYRYLKAKVPGSEHSQKYKLHIWDGLVSFFDTRTQTFPIGLYPYFKKFCEEYGYKYTFQFPLDNFRNDLSDEYLKTFYDEIFSATHIRPRDYQHESIKIALNKKRGVIVSATASGKTSLLYSMIRFFLQEGRNVLLVVPNIQLVEQTYTEFYKEYGWRDVDKYVSKMHNKTTPDFKKPVLISTFQSLAKKERSFFEKYGALIVDETHQAKNLSIKTVAMNCVNADYRIGVTGTMPKDLCSLYTITGYLGPILKEVKTKELQDQGYLAKIRIRNIILKYPIEFIKENRRLEYQDEKKAIYGYPQRNKVLNLIFNNIPDGQNSLILLENLWHLDEVKKYIEDNFDDKYSLFIIHGKIEPEVREKLRQAMETEKNIILLATFGTFSTGVSVKNIENVILYSSSRSEIRILQSIGRGLRLKDGKTHVTLWDIIDSMCYKTKSGNMVKNHLFLHWEGDENQEKSGRIDYYISQKFEYKTLEKKVEELG